MKNFSDFHFFAFLTLTLFGLLFTAVVSVDPRAAAPLHPRLDGARSSRSKTKCSAKATGTASLATAGMTTGVSGYCTASISASLRCSASNASSLASTLPYMRTSKKKGKCTVTRTTYIGSQQTASVLGTNPPGQQTSGGSNSSSNNSPGQAFGTSNGNNPEKDTGPQQSAIASDDTAPAAANNAAATQPSQSANGNDNAAPVMANAGCGSHLTITITAQSTVTVTAAASAANLNGASSISGVLGSYAPMAANSDVQTAASNVSRKVKTTCTGGPRSRANGTAASTGLLSSGRGSPYGGKNVTVPASTRLPCKNATPQPSAQHLINEKAAVEQASTSGTLSSTAAANTNVTNSIANTAATNASFDDFSSQFWAGATIGTLMRMEAIPGRAFFDYDETTLKDPIKTLADAGVNAVRVEATRGQCLGPTKFDNNATTRGAELTFTLDWGCIDVQVQTAQRAMATGMRIVLTINQGLNIPAELESLSYSQMIDNIQAETKRQLQPFLAAKIVPHIIFLENEGSDGFLFIEASTGHSRGTNDGKVSPATVDKELCGQIPTGNMASYPQLAGYYKAEILAAQAAITAAGYSTETVRFGLHSHGQYVQWKEGIVHGPNPGSQSDLQTASHTACPNAQVIPSNILAKNVSQMLTIAGFSAYPDPMTPTDINSTPSQVATLDRMTKTLNELQGYAEAYGKYDSGPFRGQYRLQGLGVEYGTSFTVDQIPQEQVLTQLMWKTVKGFSAFLGVLWYEP